MQNKNAMQNKKWRQPEMSTGTDTGGWLCEGAARSAAGSPSTAQQMTTGTRRAVFARDIVGTATLFIRTMTPVEAIATIE